MKDIDLIKMLGEALSAAQDHLDYCGYGDSWERECAKQAKLPEQINAAILAYHKSLILKEELSDERRSLHD